MMVDLLLSLIVILMALRYVTLTPTVKEVIGWIVLILGVSCLLAAFGVFPMPPLR